MTDNATRTQAPSQTSDILLRLHLRIEMKASRASTPRSGFLVLVSRNRLVARSPVPFDPGRTLEISGNPTIGESSTFFATVESCKRRVEPTEGLDFYEIEAGIPPTETSYLLLTRRLRQTMWEMNQDLRLMVNFPVRVNIARKIVETRCENVSLRGLFLHLPIPDDRFPAEGDEIRLAVILPDPDGAVSGTGRVIYRVFSPEASRIGGVAGCGTSLIFEEEERFRWEKAIRRLHDEALG